VGRAYSHEPRRLCINGGRPDETSPGFQPGSRRVSRKCTDQAWRAAGAPQLGTASSIWSRIVNYALWTVVRNPARTFLTVGSTGQSVAATVTRCEPRLEEGGNGVSIAIAIVILIIAMGRRGRR
jgi:hypothetical protein